MGVTVFPLRNGMGVTVLQLRNGMGVTVLQLRNGMGVTVLQLRNGMGVTVLQLRWLAVVRRQLGSRVRVGGNRAGIQGLHRMLLLAVASAPVPLLTRVLVLQDIWGQLKMGSW